MRVMTLLMRRVLDCVDAWPRCRSLAAYPASAYPCVESGKMILQCGSNLVIFVAKNDRMVLAEENDI